MHSTDITGVSCGFKPGKAQGEQIFSDAASVPLLLLDRDVHAMQTKAGVGRAVVDVLRKLGFLEGAARDRG